MKIKPGSYMLMLLLALVAFAVGIALSYSLFEAKLLPLLIGGVILILAAIQLARELWDMEGTWASSSEKTGVRGISRSPAWSFAMTPAWVAGLSLSVYLLGFVIAIALFVFIYLKVQRRGWIPSVSFAIVTTLMMYGISALGFQAQLYKGLLLPFLGW